jgi:hypothetical protein
MCELPFQASLKSQANEAYQPVTKVPAAHRGRDATGGGDASPAERAGGTFTTCWLWPAAVCQRILTLHIYKISNIYEQIV